MSISGEGRGRGQDAGTVIDSMTRSGNTRPAIRIVTPAFEFAGFELAPPGWEPPVG